MRCGGGGGRPWEAGAGSGVRRAGDPGPVGAADRVGGASISLSLGTDAFLGAHLHQTPPSCGTREGGRTGCRWGAGGRRRRGGGTRTPGRRALLRSALGTRRSHLGAGLRLPGVVAAFSVALQGMGGPGHHRRDGREYGTGGGRGTFCSDIREVNHAGQKSSFLITTKGVARPLRWSTSEAAIGV